MTIKHTLLATCLSMVFSMTVYSNDDFLSSSPHGDRPTESQTAYCMHCHVNQPDNAELPDGKYRIPDMRAFRTDAITLCTQCHGNENNSHIVGVTQEYSTPPDLPLDENSKVTCLTCHYVHGSLHSDQPMASISFLDQFMNRERLSRSFVLRRNNSNGELCLACHK